MGGMLRVSRHKLGLWHRELPASGIAWEVDGE